METKTHFDESADAQSADASMNLRLLAYGREVGELLSSSSAQSWIEQVWTMFGGYMLAQKELGHTPGLCDTFWSFKELLEFFEKVERIRKHSEFSV
jgi:hypothetical protein